MWSEDVFPQMEMAAPLSERGEGAYRTWNEIRALDDVEVVVLEKNKSINAKANMATVRRLNPDLIFSARFLHIFKAPIISLPRLGVLNMVRSLRPMPFPSTHASSCVAAVRASRASRPLSPSCRPTPRRLNSSQIACPQHPGALPDYRGLYTDLQAMRFGEPAATMTLHRVDTGIDTGEILNTARVPIRGAEQSLLELRLELGDTGIRMLIDEVDRIAEGEKRTADTAGTEEAPPPAAAAGSGHYFSWPSVDEYEDFERKGLKLCHQKDIDRVKFMFNPSLERELALSMAPLQQRPVLSTIGRQMARGSSDLLAKQVQAMRGGWSSRGVGVGLGIMGAGMGSARAFRTAAGRRRGVPNNRTTSFGPTTVTKR